jgi:hypothetical protein
MEKPPLTQSIEPASQDTESIPIVLFFSRETVKP